MNRVHPEIKSMMVAKHGYFQMNIGQKITLAIQIEHSMMQKTLPMAEMGQHQQTEEKGDQVGEKELSKED